MVNVHSKMQDLLRELKLENAPILSIQESDASVCNTGYIDFITPEMMGDNVFMRGTDWHSRKFLSIQYVWIKGKRRYTQVGTIFERYSDTDKVLCFGGPLLLHTNSYVNDLPAFIITLKKLQCGEFVHSDTTSLGRVVCLPTFQEGVLLALHQVLHPHLIQVVKVSIWGNKAKYV